MSGWRFAISSETRRAEKFALKKLERALRVLSEADNPIHHHTISRAAETDGHWYMRVDRRWRAVLDVDFNQRRIVVVQLRHRKKAYWDH